MEEIKTLPEAEINNFVEFGNSFHTTIKFTHEMSSEKIVFLDTEVFKARGSLLTKSLMFKHILSRRKRSNIHTPPHATL